MKNGLILIIMICFITGACSSLKKKDKTPQVNAADIAFLSGNWELNLLPSPGITLDSLYPKQKPKLAFDTEEKKFTGYTGCNTMNGPLVADRSSINFKGDIAMTMMACPGDGESVFMECLKRINKYAVSADGKELTLIQGDIALMRFRKIPKS